MGLEFFSQSTCYTFLERLRVEKSKLHRFQFFLGDFVVFFSLERGSWAKLIGADFSENFNIEKLKILKYQSKALRKLYRRLLRGYVEILHYFQVIRVRKSGILVFQVKKQQIIQTLNPINLIPVQNFDIPT